MATKSFPQDIFDQARSVLEAWRSIDPALKVGGMAAEELEADLNKFDPIDSKIKRLTAELAEARTEREALGQTIWDKVKRVRRGIQSTFGDDSPQYKIIGGTRVSDRKPNVRKAAAPKLDVTKIGAPTS
jgi:hypothetical protein